MERLYDLCSSRAYGLAWRILRSKSAAEDAVQEAFLAVWEQADRLDVARGSVVSLLLTIVHHKAVDLLRKQRGLVPLLDPADSRPLPGRPVADEVMLALDGELVRQALTSLPPEQRTVLEMAYFQGYTHAEIAKETQLPLGTVKSRLRLGLERLRLVLEGGVPS